MQQLKTGFKKIIYWNKYQSESTLQAIFSSTYRNKRIQFYNWWKKNFQQPVKIELRTYENIRKIATGQRDDYTTFCLLDYNYFTNYYKVIAIDLSKQQELDADPKAIQ